MTPEEHAATIKRIREIGMRMEAAISFLVYERAAELRREKAREGLPCFVCGKKGAGRTMVPDGRTVHRWPCRDRLL